jgi:hypothetical protein
MARKRKRKRKADWPEAKRRGRLSAGDVPLLQKHEHFVLDPQVLSRDHSETLFERSPEEAEDDLSDIPF